VVQNPFPESRRSFAEGLHILIAYLKLQNFTLVGYASLACVPTWHEDFRKDLDRVDVPTLVIRGDEDRIVPITAAGARTAKNDQGRSPARRERRAALHHLDACGGSQRGTVELPGRHCD